MKKYCIFLLLFLFPGILSAQVKGTDAVVAAVNLNVLYRGVANPVAIAVPGVEAKLVSATVSDGTIEKNGEGWVIKPGDQDKCIVTIMVKGKKVDEKPFRIMNIPNPVARIKGITSGSLSKQSLLEAGRLEAALPDFLWDMQFTVTGFTFLTTSNGYDFEEVSTSNMLTGKMKEMIGKFERGQTAVFKDITAVGPDGKARKLSPVILKLE